MITFNAIPAGGAYPIPENPREGDVVTKLRYYKPNPDGGRRIKMASIVAGIPSDDELKQARLTAIADDGTDVEIFVLRMSWSGVAEYGASEAAWMPASEFPSTRERGTWLTDNWDELVR